MHPNLAIIAQNRWGTSPKDGISHEGITVFFGENFGKNPKSRTFAKYPRAEQEQ
jgi:hypothetical protein